MYASVCIGKHTSSICLILSMLILVSFKRYPQLLSTGQPTVEFSTHLGKQLMEAQADNIPML